MYRFKNSLIAFAGLLALIGAVALVTPRTGSGQNVKTPQDVRLVGTTVTQPVSASSPLPITGNVGINGTPSVIAQQNGDWNVGITGTANVNISNVPTVRLDPASNTVNVGNDAEHPVLVRDIDNPARNAVRLLAEGFFNDLGSTSGTFESGQLQEFTVPDGKRLVIENISIWGNVASDQTVVCELHETPDPFFIPLIFINLTQVRPSIWQTNQLVRLYIEPQHQIQWICSRTGGGQIQTTNYRLVAHGYLVTIP